MADPGAERDTPGAYFALTFALAVPFWLLAAADHRQLLPALPLSALAVLCPITAACLLRARSDGWSGVSRLLRRAFPVDGARHAGVYLLAAVTMPLLMLASFVVQQRTGAAMPAPAITVGRTLALLAAFLPSAVAEELGWTGYALDPLQARFGAVRASLAIGVAWAVWHFIPLYQAGRSLSFVAWWTLQTITVRVLMVWLYDRADRSVAAVIVFHTMSNLAWMLFPVDGSFYDPMVTGVMTTILAGAVIATDASRNT
jgi:membrane protease YdiL (CAAX protease family)